MTAILYVIFPKVTSWLGHTYASRRVLTRSWATYYHLRELGQGL